MKRGLISLAILFLLGDGVSSVQADPVRNDTTATERVREHRFRPLRFWPVMSGVAVADVSVMYGLNRLWYHEEGQTSFAFYSERLETRYPSYEDDGWLDDWHTYVQQDKLGHAFVAWQLARVFGQYGQWAGLSDAQAGLFGGTVSALFQSQIEIFDGFAKEYGFSRTDVLANVAGGVIGGFKVAYPERLRWFTAKYSYHRSPFYDETISSQPALTYAGNALKDYDGISYWLVVRPNDVLHGEVKAMWPDWLALSAGYSGDGLAHPISGQNGSTHRRQFFIGLDFDVLARNDWPQPFKAIAGFFSFVRLPAPALEIGPEVRWHWIYH